MVYNDFDIAYSELFPKLVSYARSHLVVSDYAVDATHDAFTKTAEYLQKNPGSKISSFLLYRETIRSCRRYNRKYSAIPVMVDELLPVYDEENDIRIFDTE